MFCQQSQGEGICVQVAACETLIGVVEATEMVLSRQNFNNLPPFILSWITASRIVSASVKDNNLLRISPIKILKHSLKIE